MATYVPPKWSTAYVIYVGLEDQANAGLFKANPTLAAGDFKVSKDGGALANLTDLPTVTPAGGRLVKITLTATEMTADNVTVVCSDAAGAEWYDLIINIATAANQIDDIKTQTAAIEADTQDLQARIPAALIGGRMDATVGAMAANTLTASALATDAVTEISTAISSTAGSGALTTTVTVNDENAQPLDGVEVWVTSDSAGTTVVAGTLTTNAAGVVTFMLDAGTYYLWRQLSRYNFTNPTTIVVS